MKVLVLLVGALVGASVASRNVRMYSIENAEKYFEEFIKTHHKHYADKAEKQKRFEIFKHNLEEINQKNLDCKCAVFGINKFSDLTQQEFIDRYTGFKGDGLDIASQCETGSVNSTSAPDSWDWRDKGVISEPKDQGTCGSCWAFSAIGNVEAHYAMIHNQLVDLSEQQLIDCDQNSGGCNGTNNMQYPFMYLMQNNGSMSEESYPYQQVQGTCSFDASKVIASVTDCVTYTLTSEDDLKNVVYSNGPISLSVDARPMKSYTGNILQDCPFVQLDHAVLIVGYGSDNGVDYWVIKNSWGVDFGENGYIRIKRGVNACGLMNNIMVEAVVS